jgi:hypothetical protein
LSLCLGTEEEARESPRAHQRVAHGRHVVLLLLVFHEHGLTDQVPEGHAQDAREFSEHVDAGRLAPAGLCLGQPISTTADRPGQHLLRVSAALPVKRDSFSDAEVISETTHGVLPPAVE